MNEEEENCPPKGGLMLKIAERVVARAEETSSTPHERMTVWILCLTILNTFLVARENGPQFVGWIISLI